MSETYGCLVTFASTSVVTKRQWKGLASHKSARVHILKRAYIKCVFRRCVYEVEVGFVLNVRIGGFHGASTLVPFVFMKKIFFPLLSSGEARQIYFTLVVRVSRKNHEN